MTKRDYYEILGINKDSSKEEIKKAYKKLALKFHPDRASEENKKDYEERFKEISEAYAVLSDEEKRSAYNQFGHAGFDQRFSQEDIFRGANFHDIFSDIFGDNGFFGDSVFDTFFGGGRRKHRHGRDLIYNLIIDFEDAAFGAKKKISFRRNIVCERCKGTGAKDSKLDNCSFCNGTGQVSKVQRTMFGMFQQVMPCRKCMGTGKIVKHKCEYCDGGLITENKELNVNIPAGVDTGSRLRISDEGEENKYGAGDLYINIEVRPHKIFEREGFDLYLEYPISFSQAALGDDVEVPLLKGQVKIKINSGIQSGTVLRISGKGIKHLNASRYGDLFVKIHVKTPGKLNNKQKELFKQLSKNSKEKLTIKKGFFEKVRNVFV
ncbi:MAG: molecular chaperone DnaJ [Nanoarchaeota archaeon]|nr:molecular chaperone DnaJ [Nanoarchaeota archaeon]